LLPLIFNAPAGGVFFAAKDAVKSSLANLGNIPSTLVAIFVAQFPYWLVRQPSEVLKVRRQAVFASGNAGAGAAPGGEQGGGGIAAALRESAELLDVRKPGTVESLSLGFGANLAYTFPADALKFVAYDFLKVNPRSYLTGNVVNSRLRCTLRAMHYDAVTLCESAERGTQCSS
jgi:solute carrier family 25 S-adenosylmethionine transporter 26